MTDQQAHHPAGAGTPEPPRLDVDDLLDTAEIIVCCGAGGVGKTTTAAALALRAAERGRRTVVMTIDPARRLAQSMGLTELTNEPSVVADVDESAGGQLQAMMLDMKRTFDELVVAHSDAERAEQILANPFYIALSNSFSGTQEYMAMEKLGQLKRDGDWDLIVVDTPPSRSALDFLDAPERMSGFLSSRLIRILLAPARASGRAYMKFLSVGVNMITDLLNRLLGAQALKDLSMFVSSFESIFGGFQERAERTYALLQQPGTAFLVVAAPERDALREASYFAERLEDDRMPLAGMLLNRVHSTAVPQLSPQRATAGAEELEESGDSPLAAGLLRVHADRASAAVRDQRMRERFTSAHPRVPVIEVAAQAGDVHDLDGLRVIGADMAGDLAAAAPKTA